MSGLPDPEALTALPLHILVRDFPEALAIIRRFGIDAAGAGGEPVVAAVGGEMADLYAALRQATAWRAAARPGPCERAAARAAALRRLPGAERPGPAAG